MAAVDDHGRGIEGVSDIAAGAAAGEGEDGRVFFAGGMRHCGVSFPVDSLLVRLFPFLDGCGPFRSCVGGETG